MNQQYQSFIQQKQNCYQRQQQMKIQQRSMCSPQQEQENIMNNQQRYNSQLKSTNGNQNSNVEYFSKMIEKTLTNNAMTNMSQQSLGNKQNHFSSTFTTPLNNNKNLMNQSNIVQMNQSNIVQMNQSNIVQIPQIYNDQDEIYQLIDNKETIIFLRKYFQLGENNQLICISWHKVPLDYFIQLLLDEFPEIIDVNLKQQQNIIQKLFFQFKQILQNEQDNQLVDINKLNQLTNKTGLLGLIVNCLKLVNNNENVDNEDNAKLNNYIQFLTQQDNNNHSNNSYHPTNQSINNQTYIANTQQHTQQHVEQPELENILQDFCNDMYQDFEKKFIKKVNDQLRKLSIKEQKINQVLNLVNEKISDNYQFFQQNRQNKLKIKQMEEQHQFTLQEMEMKDQLIQQLQQQLQEQQQIDQNEQDDDKQNYINQQSAIIEKQLDFISQINVGMEQYQVKENSQLYANNQGLTLIENIEEVYLNGFQTLICLLNQQDMNVDQNGFLQMFYKLSLFLFDLKFKRNSKSLQKDQNLKKLLDFQINQYQDNQQNELIYTLEQNQNVFDILANDQLSLSICELIKNKIFSIQQAINENDMKNNQDLITQKLYLQLLLLIFSNDQVDYALSINTIMEDIQNQEEFQLQIDLNEFLIQNQLVILIMHLIKKIQFQDNSTLFEISFSLLLNIKLNVGNSHHEYIKQIKSVKNIELFLDLLHVQQDFSVLDKIVLILKNISFSLSIKGNLLVKVEQKLMNLYQEVQQQCDEDYKEILTNLDIILQNLLNQKNNQ